MSNDIKIVFENIKNKYGKVASWAVWKSPDKDNLASNMEIDGLFNIERNQKTLKQLQKNIIMVGYNFSRTTDNFPKFHNFHSFKGDNVNKTTLRNASKIRYAFKDTPYWGAYMTDIIKNYAEPKSENVELSNLDENFRIFRDEIKTLQANKPLIIAFGGKVHSLLKKNLKPEEYSRLVGVTHYSYNYGDGCGTYEGYKRKVLNQLSMD